MQKTKLKHIKKMFDFFCEKPTDLIQEVQVRGEGQGITQIIITTKI